MMYELCSFPSLIGLGKTIRCARCMPQFVSVIMKFGPQKGHTFHFNHRKYIAFPCLLMVQTHLTLHQLPDPHFRVRGLAM